MKYERANCCEDVVSEIESEPDTRLPAFLLETANLDNCRPWMKRVREWARHQGDIIMENHLIGFP